MMDNKHGNPKKAGSNNPFAREGGEVMTMEQVRERSRRIKLARAIRENKYEPNIDALANMLLSHPDFQK